MTSIADIHKLVAGDPFLESFVAKATLNSYEDFRSVLYSDLHKSVLKLEKDRHLLEDEGEDQTTQRILTFLEGAGYSATQSNRGGNVDIVVEWRKKSFVWIGEAKKFGSVADLREGYLQLATRYVPGYSVSGAAYGGLFAYLRRPNTLKQIDAWKSEFLKMPEAPSAVIRTCDRFGPFAFFSEHAHQVSGTAFEVWHICVQLYFNPQDESGRNSLRGQARRGAKSSNG